ncbi:pentapeptide repeat-containing protein [Candidatus Thiodubiliella endoseptemdiera]|uniref:pentapeptide repeat-containing protein n=1 Tax=Candidatus Thiodubiliella endoseptemdiera TaxID=2738886 RepID=UPI0034DF34A9
MSLVFFWFIYENPYEWEILKNITIGVKSIISITTLIITAPIAFIIWAFRDKNKLLELENARKDTNLKEFQQLQRWATGNIEGDKDNQGNKIALQISALHSLRAYLKGEYGDSLRRGAYEIFRASLATQHQKILKQVNEGEFENITIAINSCQFTKQLNIIASEEWFNLLINHNFPTNNISLLGVNLSKTYLHHCTYGKTLDLGGAQLQKANLRDAQLQGACLNNARLQGACLNNAQLQGADLRGAQLQGANLSNAQLQGADLREAQLQGAGLVCAQLQGVDLLNARLQGADLRFAQLQGANLRFAQLQGACLNNARLQKANLRDAQLQGADLREAQLQGANLNNARLQGAHTNVHYVDFKQRIEQQIDQDTTKEIRGLMYKALDDTQKSQLIAELKAVSSMCATEAIERIKSASETLDLSGASTGKYSQQDADEWLNCYHKAMKK